MNIYESCKSAIRIAFFACVLLAIGTIIQSESFNLFYTFKSSVVLFIGELTVNIGRIIMMNLPIIFMLNICCKKMNSSSPVLYGLIGYFTFLVTTMLFAKQGLTSLAYSTGYGLNSIFNISSGTRLPLETGLIGSILVAYVTRFSFILSRNRSASSFLNIFSKDSSGVIYNIFFCFVLGILVSYGYPLIYSFIQDAITYISEDLMDPLRIGLYGLLDRFLSIFGLGSIIRYPFWYTSVGGSYVSSITGQTIVGDVNIFAAIKNASTSYMGAGRFITPYYIINFFLVPGFYIGTLLGMSDRYERNHFLIVFFFGIGLSIICGNPLPIELIMLFTSPMILLSYLFLVAIAFGLLVKLGIFLGFDTVGTNTIAAMPGNFPDFIINIRNVRLSANLLKVLGIGAIFMLIFIIMIYLYYRYLAYDVVSTGKANELVKNLIKSVGGLDNIDYCGSGLFRLNIYLKDLELVNVDALQTIEAKKVTETKTGISIEFGTSSNILARKINNRIKMKKAKTMLKGN